MRALFIFFFSLLSFSLSFSQTKENEEIKSYIKINGEAKILINIEDIKDIQTLANTISLDYPKGNYWLGYVNISEYNNFLKLGLRHKLYIDKTPKAISMANTVSEMNNWDKYPTYKVYDSIMRKFVLDYPSLCKLDTIGYSVNNKLILGLKISSNPSIDLDKPKFFYTSTIHGDEIAGVVLLLRLADWLLSNYNNDSRSNTIINSTQVYINPIANPDGMYRPNDNNISYATRSNANDIDLNRNFPDIVKGDNPDGKPYQKETLAFINYARDNNFSISANLHGGAEVLNYPWDAYSSSSKTHPDKLWFQHICKKFIDSIPESSPYKLFKDISNTGYINGGDWYVVYGGRQDYHNYYRGLRELTMEISSDKFLSSNQLVSYWGYLKNSLITYIENCQKGLDGYVYDSITNLGIKSKIRIENHDDTSSIIYSNNNGYYYRPIFPGNYSITYSSEGYFSKTINLSIPSDSILSQDVFLIKNHHSLNNIIRENSYNIYPNPCKDNLIINASTNSLYKICSINGNIIKKGNLIKGENLINTELFPLGIYLIEIGNYKEKFIKE